MRRKNQFDFKQFTVTQKHSPMKVGTDGVLLGCWAPIGQERHILDIGTGTGLIALILAQRSAASLIDAIDIDIPSIREAEENFTKSPWAKRLTAIHGGLQDYIYKKNTRYDLILSNPPFFTTGTPSPDYSRHRSRHDVRLSQEELIEGVNVLLTENGSFCTILPYEEGNEFIRKATLKHLYLTEKTAFYSKKSTPIKRWLLVFKKKPSPLITQELTQYNHENQWTGDYKMLTKDFYLKL